MENIQNSAVEELPVPMSKDVVDENQRKLHKKRAPTSTSSSSSSSSLAQQQQEDTKEYAKAEDKIVNDDNADDSASQNSNSKQRGRGSNKKQTKTAASSSTANAAPSSSSSSRSNTTHQQQQQQHPPKKYSSNSSNSSLNGNNNNGANDDFKYPYQKYSKEANFRFADNDDDSDDVDDDDFVADFAAGRGGGGGGGSSYFYDPSTGRRLAPTDANWHERVHERVRRASGSPNASGRREDNKNTCSLYIQTDPLIWRHIREGIADVRKTLEKISKKRAIIVFHISCLLLRFTLYFYVIFSFTPYRKIVYFCLC